MNMKTLTPEDKTEVFEQLATLRSEITRFQNYLGNSTQYVDFAESELVVSNTLPYPLRCHLSNLKRLVAADESYEDDFNAVMCKLQNNTSYTMLIDDIIAVVDEAINNNAVKDKPLIDEVWEEVRDALEKVPNFPNDTFNTIMHSDGFKHYFKPILEKLAPELHTSIYGHIVKYWANDMPTVSPIIVPYDRLHIFFIKSLEDLWNFTKDDNIQHTISVLKILRKVHNNKPIKELDGKRLKEITDKYLEKNPVILNPVETGLLMYNMNHCGERNA